MGLWRVVVEGEERIARGAPTAGPSEFLPAHVQIDSLLSAGGSLLSAMSEPADGPVPEAAWIGAPVGTQEVWAAGVTYLRSRDARMEESESPDFYSLVYEADRPELFFKSGASRVRGPQEPIGIRADSTWDVPEPELCVVANADGRIVGYTIGNDVSSRSIEGENPLYLPQAKTYTGSCALGPCLVPVEHADPVDAMEIEITIQRGAETVYHDRVSTAQLKRTPQELVDWLFRAMEFPRGVALLTGTALVPDSHTTLHEGDRVRIAISGLGELTNQVEVVGRRPHASSG